MIDFKSRLLLGSAVASLVFGLNATTIARAADADSGQIETVVVTAEKKSEKLQDVPASITALDARTFASQGITDVRDFAAQIPGLSLTSSSPGFQQITLRGITTGQAQPGATTSLYIDESPVGSANAYTGGSGNTADLDPADVARIEVLKGPQGTLYGAGAMGGLFKYVMQEPDSSAFFGHLTVGGDNVSDGGDGYRLSGSVNVPLIDDKLALKASAYDRFEPGFIDNVHGNDNDNPSRFHGGRIALAWDVNANIKATFSTIMQDVHNDGSPVEDVDIATLKPIYGDLEQFRYLAEHQKERLNLYNATIDGNWGSLNVVSSSTYQVLNANFQSDATLSFGPLLDLVLGITDGGIILHQFENTDRFTQELRASDTAFGGALEYQFGAYFTHENDLNEIPYVDAVYTDTGLPITGLPDTPIKAFIKSQYTEYSVFGNVTYHFNDQFDVFAGLRLAYDHQQYSQNYGGFLIPPFTVDPTTTTDRIALYQVTPRYKIDENQMVYAKVATGYRPGGPNAAPSFLGVPTSFSPDKVTSYEAGYKATLLDNKLVFDTAFFYNDWKDVQIQTSASIFQYIVNGGDARTEGWEGALTYMPINGLTLGLNAAYTEANLTSPAPAASALDGDRLPFVPHWSGSLLADYQWAVNGSVTANIGGSVNYVGDRISDYSGRSPVTVPSYTVVNLHAGATYQNWELSVFAKNVGDSRGITSLGSQVAVGFNPYSAAVIQPRTVGLQLTAKFGDR